LKPSGKESRVKVAMEFRNSSWFVESVYEILSSNDIALVEVFSVDGSVPHVKHTTASWHYTRFLHGPEKDDYFADYSNDILKAFAKEMRGRRDTSTAEYVYFLNDTQCRAIHNSAYLTQCLCDGSKEKLVPGYSWTTTMGGTKSISSFFNAKGGGAATGKAGGGGGSTSIADGHLKGNGAPSSGPPTKTAKDGREVSGGAYQEVDIRSCATTSEVDLSGSHGDSATIEEVTEGRKRHADDEGEGDGVNVIAKKMKPSDSSPFTAASCIPPSLPTSTNPSTSTKSNKPAASTPVKGKGKGSILSFFSKK
jgi:hypothetical protein